MLRPLAAAALVLVVACGDGAVSTTSSPPAPTIAAPTTTAPAPPPTSTTPPPTSEPPATGAPTTVPGGRAAGPPPAPVLLAGPNGVTVVAPDGSEQPVVFGAVELAFDDTMGGVVFQEPFDFEDPPPIWWLPAGAGTAQVLVEPAAEDGWLALEDVEVIDGSPRVFYTDNRGYASPETAEGRLHARDLATGEDADLVTVGGWEYASSPMSVGGDLIALNGSAEAVTWFEFVDLAGAPVELAANPLREEDACFDRSDCPGRLAVSPNGSLIAYTITGPVGAPFPIELVVVDVASSREVARLAVRDEGEPLLRRVELGPGMALVNRVGGDMLVPEAAVVAVWEPSPGVGELAVPGAATFMRAPVATGPFTLP